ncbi:MAG: hypothetical protein ACLRG3_00865 [Bifidobacterium adolescentis]
MLGYDYGHPKILSRLLHSTKATQYDDGVKDSTDTTVPKHQHGRRVRHCKRTQRRWTYGDWNCQQRWTSIRGMISFHNAVNGTQRERTGRNRGSNDIAFDKAVDGSSTAKSKGHARIEQHPAGA